jgi:hypothetical protein
VEIYTILFILNFLISRLSDNDKNVVTTSRLRIYSSNDTVDVDMNNADVDAYEEQTLEHRFKQGAIVCKIMMDVSYK